VIRIDNDIRTLVRIPKRDDATMRDQKVTLKDSGRRIHGHQRTVFNED